MGINHRNFSKSKAWVDWLSDTPVESKTQTPDNATRATSGTYSHVKFKTGNSNGIYQKPVQGPVNSPKSQYRPEKDPYDDEIAINIHLPTFRLPKLRINWRKTLGWGAVGIVAAVIIFGTPVLLRTISDKQKTTVSKTAQSLPAYAPLTPESVSVGQVSGAQYDSKKQLYKYDDEYKGVGLTVSQQPLPDQLRADPMKLAEVAKNSINATEKIETTNGDAYIVTDEKTRTQRVVLAHRQLLVFIQSYDTLDPVDWVVYIQSLQ